MHAFNPSTWEQSSRLAGPAVSVPGLQKNSVLGEKSIYDILSVYRIKSRSKAGGIYRNN